MTPFKGPLKRDPTTEASGASAVAAKGSPPGSPPAQRFQVEGLQGLRGLGFRGLGFRGLGFRGLGFRDLGFRDLGLRGSGFWGFRCELLFSRGCSLRLLERPAGQARQNP